MFFASLKKQKCRYVHWLISLCKDHDIEHFRAAANHAVEALKHEQLTERQRIQVELAAWLHDTDDGKLFVTTNNPNARAILNSLDGIENKDEFIEMINCVSCS